MDNPLSLAANSAALLSLIVQIRGFIYKYRSTKPSSDLSGENILNEMNLLCQALKSMEMACLRSSPVIFSESGDLRSLRKAYERCADVLLALREGLYHAIAESHPKIQGWDFFQKLFKMSTHTNPLGVWPPSQNQTANVIRNLEDIRISVIAFTTSGLESGSCSPTPASIGTPSAVGNSAVRKQQERQQILDWLSAINYRNSHLDSEQIRTPGTVTWIIEDAKFKSWIETRSTTGSSLLLCVGPPGSGKTILTSQVIDYLDEIIKAEEEPKTGLAYFYFNYQTWSTVRAVLGCLLRQLALRTTLIPENIRQLWKANRHNDLPPLEELSSTLVSTCSRFEDCYIVLEAIDECPPDNFESLIYLLHVMRSASCKVFASLRDDDQNRLQRLRWLMRGASEIRAEAKELDIEKFVKFRLKEEQAIPRLIDPNDDPIEASVTYRVLEDQICKAVLDTKSRSFLLATLQLRKILEPTTRAELEELLHHLPKSADEFYRDVMDEIMDQPSVRSRLALQTFVWLCESARSLRVQELRHALAIREHKTTMDERDLPSLQTIQTVCKQMVSVDRLGQRIALLHPTFREFLNRNQERYFPDVMTQLAKAVITYLQYDELKSGPSESLEEFKWRLGKMPFLPYVAQYWGHYLVAAYRNQEVRESTLSILRSQPLLDTLSQFYVTAKSHRLFPDRFKDAPKNVNGLHMAGVFGLADAARTLISANPGLVAARDSWKRTPLHIAATNGQYAVAKLLLDHKAPTNAQDRNRKTPLHEAAASGHEDIVCLLLGERADPTVKDEEGLTALDQAAAGGQVEVVGKLLEATKECPMEKASAVRKAAEKGQSQMVEVLLDQGVTPDASILNSAAGAGIQETVSTLLERGLDPNAQDEQGRTALHAAASAGNTQIVEQLLESGASLCVSDEQDKTPLFFAVGSGDENMVRRLVDEGADIDARTTTGETALFHAAATGQIGIVKLLLSFGAAVNTIQKPISDQVHTGLDSPCGQYYTPLHAAAAEGHRQIVESLISCGAEIELEDARGLRPIHLAAENGCTEVLEFLISCCCALSPKDAEGRTPLHLAARAGQLEAVNLLLSTGDVDCNTPDKHSRTPLSYACENQQEDVVDSLLKVVEDVESGDAQGKTPLSYAVAAGNVRIVSGLLARIPGGPTGQNKSVSTALEYARKEGNQAIVELLEAKG